MDSYLWIHSMIIYLVWVQMPNFAHYFGIWIHTILYNAWHEMYNERCPCIKNHAFYTNKKISFFLRIFERFAMHMASIGCWQKKMESVTARYGVEFAAYQISKRVVNWNQIQMERNKYFFRILFFLQNYIYESPSPKISIYGSKHR